MKILLFMSILLLIVFSINYYIFSRINFLFSLNFGIKFKLIGVALGLFSMIFLIWHTHEFKSLYYFSACWMGVSFLALSILIVEHLAHNFLPFKQNHIAIFTFSLILLLAIYSILNGIFSMSVKKIEIKSDKINRNLQAVLIADTHINRFTSNIYVENLVQKIMEKNPNFVLISGDFVENRIERELISPFENLQIPVFLVLGNHEFYVNRHQEISKIFEESKINLVSLDDKFSVGQIQIRGIDYHPALRFAQNREFQEMELDTNKFNIFLNHEPKFVDDFERKGFDLLLSGHTHSGQIFPFNLFVKMAYKYNRGIYNKGKMKIYVTQGTGTWGPPMRLGSFNEITVIDFVANQ